MKFLMGHCSSPVLWGNVRGEWKCIYFLFTDVSMPWERWSPQCSGYSGILNSCEYVQWHLAFCLREA